ncbi:MAG: hypothetical protein AB1509_02685, partial [Chloroflexota bacterium]
MGEFADFRSDKYKGVRQKYQNVNQDEKQMEFHLFLLSLTAKNLKSGQETSTRFVVSVCRTSVLWGTARQTPLSECNIIVQSRKAKVNNALCSSDKTHIRNYLKRHFAPIGETRTWRKPVEEAPDSFSPSFRNGSINRGI